MELLDMQLGSLMQLNSQNILDKGTLQLVGRDSTEELLLATANQTTAVSTVYLACLSTNSVRLIAEINSGMVLSASCSKDHSRLLVSIKLHNPIGPKSNYAVVYIECSAEVTDETLEIRHEAACKSAEIFLAYHEHPVCCRLLRQSVINEPMQYFLQIRCLGTGQGKVELKKFSQSVSDQAVSLHLHQIIKKHVICCQYCPVNRSLFLLHIDSFYGDVHQFTFTSLHCSANRLVYSIVCTFPIQLGIRASRLGRNFLPTVPGSSAEQVLTYSWNCTGLAATCAMPTACDHLVMVVDGMSGGLDWLFKVFIIPNRCVFTCSWPSGRPSTLPNTSPSRLRLRWLLCDGFVMLFLGNTALCIVNANPGAMPLPVTLALDSPVFGPEDHLLDSQCPLVSGSLGLSFVPSGIPILSSAGGRFPLVVGRFPINRRRIVAELGKPGVSSGFAARLLHLLISLRSPAGLVADRSASLDPAWQLLRALLSNQSVHVGLAFKQLLLSLVACRMRAEFPVIQYRLCLGCYACELTDSTRRGPRTVEVGGLALQTSFGELFADISFAERQQSELTDSCWRRLLDGLAASRSGAAGPMSRQLLLDALWNRDLSDGGLSDGSEENDEGAGAASGRSVEGFEVLEYPDEETDTAAECADMRAFLSAELDEPRLQLTQVYKYRVRRETLKLLRAQLADQTELVRFYSAIERALAAEIGSVCRLALRYASSQSESLACIQQLMLCLAEFMPVPAGLRLAFTCLSFIARSPDHVLSRLLRCPTFYLVEPRSVAFALLHLPDGGSTAARRLKQHLLSRLPLEIARRIRESPFIQRQLPSQSEIRLAVPTAF